VAVTKGSGSLRKGRAVQPNTVYEDRTRVKLVKRDYTHPDREVGTEGTYLTFCYPHGVEWDDAKGVVQVWVGSMESGHTVKEYIERV